MWKRSLKFVVAAVPLVALIVPVATVATSAVAGAASTCPAFVGSVSTADAANIMDFNFTQGVFSSTNPATTPYQSSPQMLQLVGTHLVSGGQHVYTTSTQINLHVGLMTYTIYPGSIFTMGCSGQTRGAALEPSLYLEKGRVSAHDPRAFSGSVMTYEGLYGAVPGWHSALTFTVVRNPAKPITTLESFFQSSFLSTQSVRGVTSTQVTGAGHLNVTPYTGPRIGSCRHVRSAHLNTSANTATYFGLT